MTNAQLILASIWKERENDRHALAPWERHTSLYELSVPGATGRVWHSMLPREVFNAQQDDRVGYHCVWVKASRSTCYLSLLYLFSKIATFLSEFLLWKWSPSWLAPASHLTAAHSVSQGCPPHNSLPPAPETVTAVSITPIVLGMRICL